MLLEQSPSFLLGLVNGSFICGLLFIVMGLFRLTRHLHLYDILIYSSKKFAAVMKTKEHTEEEPLGDYADYLEKTSYTRPYLPYLAAGGLYISLSLLFSILL